MAFSINHGGMTQHQSSNGAYAVPQAGLSAAFQERMRRVQIQQKMLEAAHAKIETRSAKDFLRKRTSENHRVI